MEEEENSDVQQRQRHHQNGQQHPRLHLTKLTPMPIAPACRNTAYLALVRPLPEDGVAMWGPLPEKRHGLDGGAASAMQHASSLATKGPRLPAASPDSSGKPGYSPSRALPTAPPSSGPAPVLSPDKFLTQQKPGKTHSNPDNNLATSQLYHMSDYGS